MSPICSAPLPLRIPATVSEAFYILDGLLMNEAGRNIREQYADTGGFTDHVFAVTALLSFQFTPRIRDLPSKRLCVFDPVAVPKELKGLIGSKVRQNIITANWPDMSRAVRPPWWRASCLPANVYANLQPIPASTNWPRPSKRLDGWNGRSSSLTGCSTPTWHAPRPDRSEQRRGTPRPEKRPAHRSPK